MYRTQDPTSGELIERFDTHSDDEMTRAVDAAVKAFADWRRRPIAERTAIVRALADRLEERTDELAEIMCREMGKPVAQGRAEAAKCAWVCRFYAEHGEDFLRAVPHTSDGSAAYVRRDPLGPILAIMPWNFPFWQVLRFAAPALVAGNVVLLKHAPNTPRCALTIEELVHEAGAPPEVFRNLFLTNAQAADLIAHPSLRGVTLTGSTRAGREVAAAAGRALRPMVMELGGSDPFIVLADADLDEAADAGVASRCLNNGQSCIAAKRFLVELPVRDAFTAKLVERMAREKVGDPRDPEVTIGPLAREDLRRILARQVEDSIAGGVRRLFAAESIPTSGFFYPPTVLAASREDLPAVREELFGPVATVIPFAGEDEMLAIANSTPYGLGASLWTADRQRAERLAADIDAGAVFVNGMVKSDPRLPFGGTKDSGFGRELAADGLVEFVNLKTVWIK